MKFCEALRALRLGRGLSQSELAHLISVSRSAVAKWENGLGLPSAASYEALLSFFGVSPEELPLSGEMRKGHPLLRGVLWGVMALLTVFSCAFPFLMLHLDKKGWGFTSKAAAGEYVADDPVIHTPDFDFYYTLMQVPQETGEDEVAFFTFTAVKRLAIGYRRIGRGDLVRTVTAENGTRLGRLYTFRGRHSDYHIFLITVGTALAREALPPYVLTVDGKEFEMRCNAFFETDRGRDLSDMTLNGIPVTLAPADP